MILPDSYRAHRGTTTGVSVAQPILLDVVLFHKALIRDEPEWHIFFRLGARVICPHFPSSLGLGLLSQCVNVNDYVYARWRRMGNLFEVQMEVEINCKRCKNIYDWTKHVSKGGIPPGFMLESVKSVIELISSVWWMLSIRLGAGGWGLGVGGWGAWQINKFRWTSCCLLQLFSGDVWMLSSAGQPVSGRGVYRSVPTQILTDKFELNPIDAFQGGRHMRKYTEERPIQSRMLWERNRR